jgi:CubicO group peptidase (beta-lactamase class C family)
MALKGPRQIPAAALGITKDGRLVLAHGYGYADTSTLQPVQPDSLFRIATFPSH